ncbi:MAG: BamA/TamA family outer membrane protein, partial [Burkholderiales bacterium]
AEGQFFIAPLAALERRTADLYQGQRRVASYDIASALAGIDLGALIGHYGEVRIGVKAGVLDPELDTGPQSLSPGDSRVTQGAVTARLLLDQLDSVHFARSGWRYGASVFRSTPQLGADVANAKWDTDGSFAYSFGEHTVQIAMKFGGKIGGDPLPRYDLFQWGGLGQQSGYATGQLLGEKLKYGRLTYYRRILRGTLLEGAYGGAAIEFGKVGNPLVPGSPEGLLKSALLFIAADSPLGPVYLGYGRAADGNSSWYFYLGKPF